MPKVAPIDQRKADHIRINLEEDVRSSMTTGLDRYRFQHQALPELNLEQVDTSLNLFGKMIFAPLLISSMTGGTADAERINHNLAEAAQSHGIAMGVGSQRAALEDSSLTSSFSVVRRAAPDILLFANLGAVQLNYGYTIDHCRRAIDMIEADALILHLNPLQEALQQGGDTNWIGIADKIEAICRKIGKPVIAKEVGWGISKETTKLLSQSGVSAIDVAGAGGTSWSQVEMYRAPDEFTQKLAATYVDWGISTSESILNVKNTDPNMIIFASGGITGGLDITKCIALGASLGGMAGPFLKAASVSAQKVSDIVNLTKRQVQVTMFAAGASNLQQLMRIGVTKTE